MKNLDQYYETYAHEVYLYIFSLCHHQATAEDVMQETFFRAYHHLADVQDERIKAWLFRVAYNTFIDVARKNQRAVLKPPEFFSRQTQGAGFEKTLVQQEELQEVLDAMDQLPFNQKQALTLFSIHKLSHQEIADILEISVGNVKSLIFRARATLKKGRNAT